MLTMTMLMMKHVMYIQVKLNYADKQQWLWFNHDIDKDVVTPNNGEYDNVTHDVNSHDDDTYDGWADGDDCHDGKEYDGGMYVCTWLVVM